MSASDRCMTVICHSVMRLDWMWFFAVFCLSLKLTVHSPGARRFTSCLVSAPMASFAHTNRLFTQLLHFQFAQLVLQGLLSPLSLSLSFSLSLSQSVFVFDSWRKAKRKSMLFILFNVQCDNGSRGGVMLQASCCTVHIALTRRMSCRAR